MTLFKFLRQAVEDYDQEEEGRHQAIISWLSEIKELLMPLQPEVQALHDAVVAQGEAIAGAVAEISSAEGHVVELQAKVAELQAKIDAAQQSGGTIAPEDLAEIVSATNNIQASIQTIKSVMPVPVAPAVVDAAAAASPQA